MRLEQIYGAYTRFLPPRHQEAPPTKIILIRSLAEYREFLQGQGANILNPAFFDVRLLPPPSAFDAPHFLMPP